MANISDFTNFETCKVNKKVIIKPKTHFKWLQYILYISKIEILVLFNDILTLF